MANATSQLGMSKKDFTFVGWSESLANKDTHVEVTPKMMAWVEQDPKANGPKLLLYLVQNAAIDPGPRDEGFIALLRKTQKEIDDGAKPADAEAFGGLPAKQVQEQAPEAKADDAAPAEDKSADALAELRKAMEAMPTNVDVLEYATKTLGLKLSVDKRHGKERIIEAVIAAMAAK